MIPFGLFEMREGRALMDALGDDGRAAHLRLYTSGADVCFPLLLVFCRRFFFSTLFTQWVP